MLNTTKKFIDKDLTKEEIKICHELYNYYLELFKNYPWPVAAQQYIFDSLPFYNIAANDNALNRFLERGYYRTLTSLGNWETTDYCKTITINLSKKTNKLTKNSNEFKIIFLDEYMIKYNGQCFDNTVMECGCGYNKESITSYLYHKLY